MNYVEQGFRKLVKEFSNYYGVRIEVRGTAQHLPKILAVDMLRVQESRRGSGSGITRC
jgi:hypothetical protein